MTDTDDPLDGADIGETRTVTNTEDIWLGQLEHEAASGTDRLSERRLDDVEVVTDEYGDKHLRVTVESDVTKRLPYRWDESAAPRTESERKADRRKRWGRHAATIGVNLTVVGIALAVGVRVMNSMAGEVVINGEPMAPIGWPAVAPVALIAVFVMVALPYLPGMAGVGR